MRTGAGAGAGAGVGGGGRRVSASDASPAASPGLSSLLWDVPAVVSVASPVDGCKRQAVLCGEWLSGARDALARCRPAPWGGEGQEAASTSPGLWGSGPSRLRPGPLSMTHEDVTSERRSVPRFPRPYGEDDNGTPFEGIRGGPLPKEAFPWLGTSSSVARGGARPRSPSQRSRTFSWTCPPGPSTDQ